MNRYSFKLLKWIKGAKSHDQIIEKIQKWRNPAYYAACLHDLADKGYIKYTDTGYLVEENRRPVPADDWYITPAGINYLQEEKDARFWRLIPFAASTLIAVAALVLSIIALLKQ